ncbi:MAG: hypothetical protein ACD_77C00285G0001 [uncultured bacterium]|nr:MAG: hypothetical protein ACD_77C00285G0001 [uncultured bacterium]
MFRVILIFSLISHISSYLHCQNEQEIPINSDRDVTLVTIKIGKIIIPNILLDTGFPWDGVILYNPSYRDSIDLSGAVQATLGGAGSGNAQQALMVDSAEFSIGNVNLTNQRIVLLQSDIYKGFPSNGIIGYSIFGHYALEINYNKNILILHDPETYSTDSSWTSIPMYFKNNSIPWIDASVSINEEEPIVLSMYIDLAARDALVLLEKPSMKFALPKNTTDILLGTGLSGDIYGKKGEIANLIIGSYSLKNLTVSIASSKVRSKQKDADAILGSGSLKKFNIIFDYKGGKLFLKPNLKY